MSKRPKDLDALERKVKPIYDALDSHNWKGALKLCQQALKKFPDNELIRALKAIGLERSGKREEANQVVDEVIAGTPTDEHVLRLAAMVLRGAGRLPDITRMYEAAAAAVAPRGGELALVLQHEVFGGYVREQKFVKQQQVALKLSKGTAGLDSSSTDTGVSSERYSWWVVLSILLQARAALRARATGVPAPTGQVPPVALEPEKLLALAEGMMARQAAKDGRLEGSEALMVYVDVLLAQGKTSEALSLVSGPLGASALRLPAERLQLRAVLSALTGDLAAASELLCEGLALNPDDWGALLLLLDCMLPSTASTTKSPTSSSSSPSQTFIPQHPLILISGGLAEQLPPHGVPLLADRGCNHDAFNRAEAVLRDFVERAGGEKNTDAAAAGNRGGRGWNGGSGKAMTMRGPDLALVDLAMRRHSQAGGAAALDCNGGRGDTGTALMEALLSYYRKYGSLVSCAVDLRTYVSRLDADMAGRLAEALQAEAGVAAAAATEVNVGTALGLLRRRVCAAQIRDDLGLPHLRSCEDGVELSRELFKLYDMAQPLQAGLDERERGAADELPVLAGGALMSAAGMAPSNSAAVPYMLAAYGAFADAVRMRPFCAGMRISLASLAALLAAPGAAAAHMYKLDIKHIQMDTLGAHLLLPPLLAWPHGDSNTTTVEAAELPPLASSSHGDVAGFSHSQLLHKALRDTQALFDDHARDAGESLFTAYGHGMYTKVLEFTAFRERLAVAHTLASVRAESAVADCLRAIVGNSGSSTINNSTAGGNGSGVGTATAGVEARAAVDIMRSGAVAAASRLNLEDLPSSETLRHNWDLSTRPTWLPPCSTGPSAAVVDWWRSRAAREICGQGYGRCWWSATGSAESSSSVSATLWRASQASALAHRWMLPHCIAGALGASGPGVISFREAVAKLRAAAQEPAAAAATAVVPAPAVVCMTVGSDDLRRLDVALYSAALTLQDCLERPAEDDLVDIACSALTELTAKVRQVADKVTANLAESAREAAAWGGVLPGGVLAVVSLLVREPLPVAACCMQSWRAALKAYCKRRVKAGAQMEDAVERLMEAVTAVRGHLAAVASDLMEVLTSASTRMLSTGTVAAAEQAISFLKAQSHADLCTSQSALIALEGLIQEQRTTAGLIAKQVAAVVAALSGS